MPNKYHLLTYAILTLLIFLVVMSVAMIFGNVSLAMVSWQAILVIFVVSTLLSIVLGKIQQFSDSISTQATIALQNAQHLSQIEGLNQNLQVKVAEATAQLQRKNSEMHEAYRKLQTLDEMKDQLIAITSHELRTPMTVIKSYLWMSLNRPDMKLSEKMSRYISRAYISTERLINLINDMLNVSRIEAGRIDIRPEVFDIQNMVSEIITEITPKFNEKGLNVHILKNQIPQVFADMEKVREIVLNLLGNSIKFTPAQGTITISFFSDGKTIETSIKDTGRGIAKEDMPKLFQKFMRLDSSYVASATSGGTGLGLYISKNLVDLMHGKIWVCSGGSGLGSMFTFSLPAATKEVLDNADQYCHMVEGESKHLEPAII